MADPGIYAGGSTSTAALSAAMGTKLSVQTFTVNTNQNAGTYDLCTATGGDVWVEVSNAYISVAGAGFTTVAIQTNHSTPKSIIAALAVVGATLDLSATVVTSSFYLPVGKKVQYTLVGNGSGGQIQVVFKAAPGAGGVGVLA